MWQRVNQWLHHVVQRFQLRFLQEIAFAATVGHAPLFQI
jgi:hypothetical protein